MKILKGQKYLCVSDVFEGNKLAFKKGQIYIGANIDVLYDSKSEYYPIIKEIENAFIPLSSAKWAIKRTPENAEVVNRWANENRSVTDKEEYSTKPSSGMSGYIHSDDISPAQWHKMSSRVRDGYTEIDFETFKEITGMGEEKPKQLLGEKEAVHCPTLELAEKVIEIFKENGTGRCDKRLWDVYKKDSVFDNEDGYLTYGDLDWYKTQGYTIIPAEQFIKDYEASKVLKIEKGQKYLCVEDVIKPNSDFKYFIKGKVYNAHLDYDNTLIDEESKDHEWIHISESNTPHRFFQPLSSAKWAIKRTPKNAEVVNRWANENFEHDSQEYYCSKYDYIHSSGILQVRILDGYTEIDFETFKEITGMGEEKEQPEKLKIEFNTGRIDVRLQAVQSNEEWQPKWGEPVEVSDDNEMWTRVVYVAKNPREDNHIVTLLNNSNVTSIVEFVRPISIHTFTTEQAKQYLAKLHNILPSQIEIKD